MASGSSPVDFAKRAEFLLYDQLNKLTTDPVGYRKELRKIDEDVERLALEILSTEHPENHATALNVLMHARGNTAVNTSEGSPYPRFNTLCKSEVPAIINVAYDSPQVPLVSIYQYLSNSVATYRLAPSCIEQVPDELLSAVGNLQGKRVDLFCETLACGHLVDGAFMSDGEDHEGNPKFTLLQYNQGRPFNLNLQQWVHHDALFNWDVKRNVDMGLFPVWGVSSAYKNTTHRYPQPIALEELKPLEVYTHPIDGTMRYSPDTAHFMINPLSPFSITWAAARDGQERVLISRLLLLNSYEEDPIVDAIIKSGVGCKNLTEHLSALSYNIHHAIDGAVGSLKTALERKNLVEAQRLFEALPQWHQHNIFKFAYLFKGQPNNIHRDFGRQAFCHGNEIDPKYHLSPEEKLQVVETHIDELTALLLDEPKNLLHASLEMRHSDRSKQLFALAEKFKDHDPSAMGDYGALPSAIKNEIRYSIWRLNGHPRDYVGDFGADRFAGADHRRPACTDEERAKAIYLAISGQRW